MEEFSVFFRVLCSEKMYNTLAEYQNKRARVVGENFFAPKKKKESVLTNFTFDSRTRKIRPSIRHDEQNFLQRFFFFILFRKVRVLFPFLVEFPGIVNARACGVCSFFFVVEIDFYIIVSGQSTRTLEDEIFKFANDNFISSVAPHV